MNKKLATLLFSTAIITGLACGSTAFAEGTQGQEKADKVSPDVRITKTFKTPETLSAPLTEDFTFNFNFVQDKYYPYGDVTETPAGSGKYVVTGQTADFPADSPVLGTQTLEFKNNDADGTKANGMKTRIKQTDNILAGVMAEGAYKSPGVYTYKVTEAKNSVTLKDASKESLKYDGKTYELKVYVKNVKGKTQVTGGTVYDPSDPDGKKLNPDPKDPTPETTDESNTVTEANGFNFENIYTKKANNVPDPKDPDGKGYSFVVTKEITGDLAKPEDDFTFTLELTGNDLVKASTNDFVLKTTENTTGQKIAFDLNNVTAPKTFTFTLKGGQKAWIENMPVGVHAKVTEAAKSPYTQSVKYGFDVVDNTKFTEGTNVADGYLGDQLNEADYTNKAEDITPTGLLLNNLPYVMMALAAVGGFAAYIMLKRRQRN